MSTSKGSRVGTAGVAVTVAVAALVSVSELLASSVKLTLGLAVLQSANLWGRPVTFFACTFAPGAQAEGTISEFFRELARPAGFEPATLGLEGRLSDRLYQAVISTE